MLENSHLIREAKLYNAPRLDVLYNDYISANKMSMEKRVII